MHVIAGKAVALKEAMEPEFKVYQQQVAKNAKAMVEVFLSRGYKVVSGGTENHLFLLDLVDKNLTGKEADAALGRANITVNKNSVPNDPKSPFVTSGIRIGSPAVTRRGFKEAEVKELAGWMCDVLDNINDEAVIESVKESAGYLRALPGLCVTFNDASVEKKAASAAFFTFGVQRLTTVEEIAPGPVMARSKKAPAILMFL
jgi:glycine hydroxymethyltransferase